MDIKFWVFMLVALLVYGGISYYIGWNFRVLLKHYGMKKGGWIYWVLFSFISATPFLWRFMNVDFIKVMSDYWMFFFSYGLMLAIVSNIISLIVRRKYTKIIGTVAVGVLLISAVVGQYNAFKPVVKEITIDRPEVAKDKQLKVVFAADLHLGILSNRAHLKNFVELSNEQNPDIVVLVGDIVDDSTKWFTEQGMEEELKKLKSKYGVYGVLGNHEYIGDELKEFAEVMEQSNVTLLQDETVTLGNGMQLTGRDDATNDQRLSIQQLEEQLTSTEPWLVLDHQPTETLDNPNVDLMLFGHTHHGQIWPGNLLVESMYSNAYGHKNANGTDYITTSGYGFWGPPMRIATDSELWSITMNYK